MSVIDFSKAQDNLSEKRPYSKKLLWFIRDFITQRCNSYYDDEADSGIVKLYYKLTNGIAVEHEVIVREEDCLCYTTLSVTLSAEEEGYSRKLYDLLFELNEINCSLDYGHFEYASGNGDIRFKTSYEPGEGIICYEDMDKFLYYSHFVINKYADRILKALEKE